MFYLVLHANVSTKLQMVGYGICPSIGSKYISLCKRSFIALVPELSFLEVDALEMSVYVAPLISFIIALCEVKEAVFHNHPPVQSGRI